MARDVKKRRRRYCDGYYGSMRRLLVGNANTIPGQPEVATDLPLIYYLIHTPLLRSAKECTTSYMQKMDVLSLWKQRQPRSVTVYHIYPTLRFESLHFLSTWICWQLQSLFCPPMLSLLFSILSYLKPGMDFHYLQKADRPSTDNKIGLKELLVF